jgi:acyl-CoA oxidase
VYNASRAYSELYTFNEFHKRIKRCRDENTKSVFNKLHDLFSWSCLEKDLGTFLEMGHFGKEDVGLIRSNVQKYSSELKREVIGIVDAIAPPDHVLNSPIGAADGDIYNRFINTVWTAPGAFEKAPYWKEIHKK